MPSNVRKTLDRMRQSRSGFINNEAFARNLNRSLSFDPINTIFVRGTSEYEDKFIDQTARRDDSIIPKLIYGEVWLDSQVINRGIKRSTADPSQLVDEFEVVNGIGKNEGLKNDAEDTEDGLNNLLINGLAAVLGGIALYKIADFIYKRNNDDGNSIWEDVTDVVGKEVFGDEDPNTGEKIEQQTDVNQPKLEELKNVESVAASKDDIIIYGKNGETCGWLHKNFNQAIIDSGLDVLGLDIEDSGDEKASDIDTLNFGDNLSVTVDGDGKITVDGASGEVNAVNVGGGAEVFRDKTDDNLNLRTLVGGDNITVTENNNTIVISTSVSGSDDGDGDDGDGDDGGTDAPSPDTSPCEDATAEPTINPVPCTVDDISNLGLTQSPAFFNVDAVDTDCIDVWFHFDGLFTEKELQIKPQGGQPFPCGPIYPLLNGTSAESIKFRDDGEATLTVTVIATVCGDEIIIHQAEETYSGFNEGPFKKSIRICWDDINFTGCLNKFPGLIINPQSPLKIRVDKSLNSCRDVAVLGYSKIQGDDWFDGGRNLANKFLEEETFDVTNSPLVNPETNIYSDGGIAEVKL